MVKYFLLQVLGKDVLHSEKLSTHNDRAGRGNNDVCLRKWFVGSFNHRICQNFGKLEYMIWNSSTSKVLEDGIDIDNS